MFQYIFFIYNSSIIESNEESNVKNHCILYQNQGEYLLGRDITKKIYNSQNFGQDDAYVKSRDRIIISESENPIPLDFSNEVIDLTQKSEENIQSNLFAKTRTRKKSCMPFHSCKKLKLMANESENFKTVDFFSEATRLNQKSEENIQSNLFAKTRTRKKSCMPFHSCKKLKLMANESENFKTVDFFSEAIRLNQKLEENSQNVTLENESEKSFSENKISIPRKLLEATKCFDAEDKKDSKKTFDSPIKKDPFEIIADQILKFQNEFLGSNQNVVDYDIDVIKTYQELQESYKTLDLKKKLIALNSFIKKEFKYNRQFILNFFKAYNNLKREKKYGNSRKILIRRKNNIRSILSSKVSYLKDLISKSILEPEMKEYLLDYIEFIKIRLEHIMKLIPNYYLQSDNSIKLLYWYMRFINESNILDNLFDLVSLQKDFFKKKIALLLDNENIIAFSNCLAIYSSNKEFYIRVCINHTIFGFIKKNFIQ